MGLLVAFWSPLHGRGTTANTMASATQFSYTYDADVVITHTHYERSIMETAYLTGKEDEDLLSFSDLGIDSIERALKTNVLKNGDFKTYCNKLNENLYFLSGTKKASKDLFKLSIGSTFESLCEYAKESNDITFIDVDSIDKDNPIIELADIVVVNLDQTNYLCEEYFSNKKNNRISEDKEMIVIGKFDFDSKYDKKCVDNLFSMNVVTIPQVSEYLDAINNHKVENFFRTYYYSKGELFFDEVNRLNEMIVEKAREKNISFQRKEYVPLPVKKKRISIWGGR